MARKDDLKALADLLWASLGEADPDKRAPLANQYRATLAEIEELSADEQKVGDPIDALAARRAARGGSTARPHRSAGDSG